MLGLGAAASTPSGLAAPQTVQEAAAAAAAVMGSKQWQQRLQEYAALQQSHSRCEHDQSSSCSSRSGGSSSISSSSSGTSLVSFVAAAGASLPYLSQLDLSGICMHSLAGSTAGSTSLLACIAGSCPRLAVLQLPGWLWKGLGETLAASAEQAAMAATAKAKQQHEGLAWGSAGCCCAQVDPGFSSMLNRGAGQKELCRAAGLQQAMHLERLTSLAGLKELRVLRLVGAPVPLEVLAQLSVLTQLQSLAVSAECDLPLSEPAAAAAAAATGSGATTAMPAASSLAQRAQQQQQWDADEAGGMADAHEIGSSSSRSSGTILGAALCHLRSLTQLSLSCVSEGASSCLSQLSGLLSLSQLDIKDCPDLRVQALAQLSGLSGLRVLKVRRVLQLKATARTALPLELQQLRQLSVAIFDFDLHLRDIQVRRRDCSCV